MADLDYFLAVPLGWREGTVIVWAGMRGAVTLAAAQTLPADTPVRSLLVLTAFFVAAFSLIGQGGTLPWIVRAVKPAGIDVDTMAGERAEVRRIMRAVAEDVVGRRRSASGDGASPSGNAREPDLTARLDPEAASESRPSEEEFRRLRLEIIAAQRAALLEARDDGIFSSAVLSRMLETLDADQISMELRGDGD